MEKVKVWKETVKIPTYPVGEPEKYPIFIEKRVYQGSSGAVYPYPIIEKISDHKIEKEYLGVFLENKYVKVMVLPELGGRIQMAYDKTKKRHFVYHNEVIKPALVGLTGPWISGGIEFNWPQHHRPTTFEPVDYHFEENKDGSATIWCNELERMSYTKGLIGFTIYPDKSYIELTVKLYNKSSFPQTFLWWANPALKANDHYQSVFPPDIHAVFDHGKRDVSSFPVATGTYYKVDYSPGTDISKYKNIPVPTSYMGINSKYDFLGGYENDTKAGLLHVANHHISPGKKQWTWGNGEFGKAWNRNLTDQDEHYVELMCGVYTDNQPDFTWIMPNEEKRFSQYFMPYRDVGMVKNANKDIMINFEVTSEGIRIRVYTTSKYPECKIFLYHEGELIFTDTYNASPALSYDNIFPYTQPTKSSLKLVVLNQDGIELISWESKEEKEDEIPTPAKAALKPEKIESIEELYLTGLHLEQYRHATFNPIEYYKEALRREPSDSRNNNALGLLYLKRGRFKKAEKHFNISIQTLTKYNPNPYNGEPFYNLGICYTYQRKYKQAYDVFYKSIWDASCKNSGYFYLAQLDCINKDWESALEHIECSISANKNDHKALHLKVVILRKLGKIEEANELAITILSKSHFEFGVFYEAFILTQHSDYLEKLYKRIRNNIHNYIEYALDYSHAGLLEDAIDLLTKGIEKSEVEYPMAWYYLSFFNYLKGDIEEAKKHSKKAANCKSDFCFPNRIDDVITLQKSIEINPHDAKAHYYLGNYWYNAKQYNKAVRAWEASLDLDSNFAGTYRNLSFAYYNKFQLAEKAVNFLEKSFSLDPNSRILMELDQLYKRLNKSSEFRFKLLQKNFSLVKERDDLFLELITLYNTQKKYNKALFFLRKHKFHPWEGGEGKVIKQYTTSLTELAKLELEKNNLDTAREYLIDALNFPENLGEGKLPGALENDIYYWLGVVEEKSGDNQAAVDSWEIASKGELEPHFPLYYNDSDSEKIFYKGLALLKLNESSRAADLFTSLIEYGKEHKNNDITIDYFAISLPDLTIWEDDLNYRNFIYCHYLIGLGFLGLGDLKKAKEQFKIVLKGEDHHLGARIHLKNINNASNLKSDLKKT